MRLRPDGSPRSIDQSLVRAGRQSGDSGDEIMKALASLFVMQSLDLASGRGPRPAVGPESALPPLATTAETAVAWRRWAEAGRSPATSTPVPATSPWATAVRRVSTVRRATGGAHL
jgi:hypothetical protein